MWALNGALKGPQASPLKQVGSIRQQLSQQQPSVSFGKNRTLNKGTTKIIENGE